MVTTSDATETGAYGRAPDQWAAEFEQTLEVRDHRAMQAALQRLRRELGDEVDALERFERGHVVARLVEHARRLLRAQPDDRRRLHDELGAERALWACYRQRYRQTFVPAALHPFLDGCAAFLSRATDGVQFTGTDKYTGVSRAAEVQAVTLFHSVTAAEDRVSGCGETPANFFSNYQARQGRFVVERAYRTFLPPGAGQQVIAEHMSWLVEDHSALAELVFDNVQNRVTYETHVDRDGDERTLRPGVEAEATPLGRLALRLLEPFGATSIEARPVLDGFGFLDLRLVINR